jgi:hypothetical protein
MEKAGMKNVKLSASMVTITPQRDVHTQVSSFGEYTESAHDE